VGVGWSGEGDRWWWCGFNASVSALDGRQWDEVLSKDEAETASSFWLHAKKCDISWRCRSDERWHQRWKREETMRVGLTRILLGQKMNKIHAVDSAATNGR
jgi:hypothetical protein